MPRFLVRCKVVRETIAEREIMADSLEQAGRIAGQCPGIMPVASMHNRGWEVVSDMYLPPTDPCQFMPELSKEIK